MPPPDSSLTTPEEALRARIISLLLSKSVLKIDFRLAKYRITGYGFRVVIGLLNMRAVKVVIDPDAFDSTDAAAVYSDLDDTYYFPNAMFGMSLWDRMAIVHESVHAILDAKGGGKYHRRVDNEAAAYVANALYVLNLPNAVPSGLDKMFKLTFEVAAKLRADRSRIPTVSQDDLDELRDRVGRRYRRDFRPLTRDIADGNPSPISILAPLYGLRK